MASRSKRSRTARSTCRFEVLEDRRLMSVGGLDTSFGNAGAFRTGFYPMDVAVQSDGKSVVIGNTHNNFAVMRLNANGTPDESFGTHGFTEIDLGGSKTDQAQKVAIQNDGKIVVAGVRANGGGNGSRYSGNFALMRLNTNGSLDASFGNGGTETVLGSGKTYGITGLGFQSNGKIVFSGDHYDEGWFSSDSDFIAVRLNTNGSLDTTFGESNGSSFKGYRIIGMGGDDLSSVQLIQPDGKILVGGTRIPDDSDDNDQFAIARLTASGDMDPSFDGDGKVIATMVKDSWLYGLTQQADGKIIAAGGFGNQLLLRRFNADGSYDLTWGTGSVLLKGSSISTATVATSVMARGDKIVVVGMDEFNGSNGHVTRSFAAQYLLNGQLDTSFGTGGLSFFDLGGAARWPKAVAAPDGKVVFGFGGDNGGSGVARFTQAVPTVSMSSNSSVAGEGSNNGSFVVSRDAAYDFPTRVYLNVGGSAANRTDYTSNFIVPMSTITIGKTRGFRVGGLGGLGGLGGVILGTGQPYIDIPAGQSSVVLPVNVINDTALEPVESADFSLATSPTYQVNSNAHAASIKIADDDQVHVNFQATSNGLPPPDRAIDIGQAFGARDGGLTYGWDKDNTANARNRGKGGSPDFRFDSLNHMQKNGANRKWEIAVPNGLYTVRLVAGDPSNTDAVYKMNLENTLAVSGTPAGNMRWFMRTINVQVNDGRLTLSNASGAQNNRVCFLDIKSAPIGATAGAVSDNIAFHLGDPAPAQALASAPPIRIRPVNVLTRALFSDKSIDVLPLA